MAPTPQMLQELDLFPAGLLAELPDPLILQVCVPGFPPGAALICGKLCERHCDRWTAPVFDATEVRALVAGVASERFDASDFLACCLCKTQDQAYRLTLERALDSAHGLLATPGVSDDACRSLTARQLLDRLKVVLTTLQPANSTVAQGLASAA